ncbi:hypothetical protein [Mycobacterium sp.]|uniref:hypothetical protein n=1 Tax=Mycobacterium sp. TaxID=1785 RepID=UPI0031DEAC9F
MTRFLRRLLAAIAAVGIPLAIVAVATSTPSSAACDPKWSHNVWNGECHPPPAPPDWYSVRPAYAPPYAPVDVPPPPPPPPGAGNMQPRWDEGGQHWIWAGI